GRGDSLPQRWNHVTTGNPDALIRCEAIQTNQSSMALIDHVQMGINLFLNFFFERIRPPNARPNDSLCHYEQAVKWDF
ncbi:MAG: hypothetical protein PHF14_12455, partial [Verrucomicrobiota bacterium]|nr:hypothetical protein [Verrucomicrobiota bacterium]